MIREAVILAGGFGTRLKGVVSDVPKPMAPVASAPFLEYILQSLSNQGILHVVLAVGYKSKTISDYFGRRFKNIDLTYAVENEPLGTGGAISFALSNIKSNAAFILNGDSFINVDLKKFDTFCQEQNANFGMVLKEMTNFDRYGTVVTEGHRVKEFKEKQTVDKGFINCGLYWVNKAFLSGFKLPQKYSFETEFMEKFISSNNFSGYVSDGYFIDIGIPEDYEKAQKELPAQIKLI